jgi:glycyl-tRNA synthetase beta chain
MATVLLELGTEEMPAGYVAPALAQFAQILATQLASERITYDQLVTWGTPRRLAVQFVGMIESQLATNREIRGPRTREAFAPNGEPTQAALGFARRHEMSVQDLRMRTLEGEEYLVAVFPNAGQATLALLPRLFTRSLTALTFPQTMRWGTSPLRFARPIRWLVALWNEQVIPTTAGEVVAGRHTRGHRFLSPEAIAVATAGDYLRIMEENHVLVDPDARRATLEVQLEHAAHAEGAHLQDDGSLLEETTFSLEYPTVVRGSIDPRFLSLPSQVLIQVLRYEQHVFPLVDATGQLLPAFLAVRNGDKAYLGTVRDGYEAVVRAKLIDALFFFEQDCARPLAERVEKLRGVVFQEKAGTYYAKAERMAKLAAQIAARLNFSAEARGHAARAAWLAKADLTTGMVTEHPTLRGAMGDVYARVSNEPDSVAQAIGEHYHPRNTTDFVPETPLGRVVALADKLDTLGVCFAVEGPPGPGDDPYALHAHAHGVMRILLDANWRIPLTELVTWALAPLRLDAETGGEVARRLQSFLDEHLEQLLTATGVTPAVLQAVKAVEPDVPANVARRVHALVRRRGDDHWRAFERLAARAQGVARHRAPSPTDEAAVCDSPEAARVAQAGIQVRRCCEHGDFQGLFEAVGTLAPVVETLLAGPGLSADLTSPAQVLLTELVALFDQAADFTRLA